MEASTEPIMRCIWRSKCPQPQDPVDRVDTRQHALTDQVAQRLGGAAAQGSVTRAAIEARHREFVGEAVAAMDLDRLAGHPQRHLVAIDLGDRGKKRIGKRIGASAGAVEHAAARLDVLVHLGDLPAHALKLADRAAERLALLDVAHRLLEGAFGEPERNAGIEATLGVEGGEQLPEPVLAQYQILRRQHAILEADLVQILAAHRVELAGDRKPGGALLDQYAADAGAARLSIDPGEDDKHPG